MITSAWGEYCERRPADPPGTGTTIQR
jgi:hypothetical protein